MFLRSPTFDPSERPPLQPLPSANCTTSTTTSTDSTSTTSKSPACKRLHHATSAGVLSLEPGGTSTEPPPGPVAPAGPEQRAEQSPEGAHSGGQPQEAGTGEGGSPPASGNHAMTLEVDQRVGVEKEDKEQQEEEEEHDDDDDVVEGGRSKRKKRLYNMATELLTSERAYVARLHLLDKVWL